MEGDTFRASTAPPQPPHLMRWVGIFFILALVLGALFSFLWFQRPGGSVDILLIDLDGMRQVGTYSLRTGMFAAKTGVDASVIRIEDAFKEFTLSDGSTISVEAAGIIRKEAAGVDTMTLLVATPIAAVGRIPLAVSKDGVRIAWRNPADGSLQVFDRNSRGTYLPLYLNKDMRANSIGFTEDGEVLVVALVEGEETHLYAVDLSTNQLSSVGVMGGIVTILSTP